MKAFLIIEGRQNDGRTAVLYRGNYNPEDVDDQRFHTYLLRHYKALGWKTWFTMTFLTREERFDDQ